MKKYDAKKLDKKYLRDVEIILLNDRYGTSMEYECDLKWGVEKYDEIRSICNNALSRSEFIDLLRKEVK